MSPEFGISTAVFSVLIMPGLVFMLSILAGFVAGFICLRFVRRSAFVRGSSGSRLIGLLSAVMVIASLKALWTPPSGFDLFPAHVYAILFVSCALLVVYVNGRSNRDS